MDERARKGAGVALVILGALTTVPILLNVRAGSAGMLERDAAARLRGSMGQGTERHGAGAFHDASTP